MVDLEVVVEQIDRQVHLDQKYKHLNPVILELMVLEVLEDPILEQLVKQLAEAQVVAEPEVSERLLQPLQVPVEQVELVKLLVFQDLA